MSHEEQYSRQDEQKQEQKQAYLQEQASDDHIARSLTRDEQRILRLLREKNCLTLSEIKDMTGLDHAPLGRAIQWLEQKGLIIRQDEETRILERTVKGRDAARYGLPEERLARLLQEKEQLSMHEAREALGSAFNIALGILKRSGSISIVNGMLRLERAYTSPFTNILQQEELSPEHPHAEELIKRGLYTPVKHTRKQACLTEKGRSIPLYEDLEEKLTPEMIRTGSYARRTFRFYTVTTPIPPAEAGSLHFTTRIIQHIRHVWLSLGFEEIDGSLIQTAFWNFDALFTPQNHPARDMQDTFFIKHTRQGRLPDTRIVRRVKKAHEYGWTTRSSGWQQDWSRREARRLVLRTHTTVLSAQALSRIRQEDLPVRIFTIGPVFRNETLDWKHLFEFHQVEGIVVAPRLTFSHLKGYLIAFFTRLGYSKVRLRPAYFPYTELSVEVDVHVPGKGWMELGGAGIFRPEVVKPLTGKWLPVLAWGLGLGRIIMQQYGFTDIRDIQSARLSLIRSLPDPDTTFYMAQKQDMMNRKSKDR